MRLCSSFLKIIPGPRSVRFFSKDGRRASLDWTAIRQHCPFPSSRSPPCPIVASDRARRRRRRRCCAVRVGVLAVSPDNGAAAAVPPLSFAARARSRSMIAVVACGRRCFVGRAGGRADGEISRCGGKRANCGHARARAKGAQSGIGLRRGHTGSEEQGKEEGREVYLIRAVLTINSRSRQ